MSDDPVVWWFAGDGPADLTAALGREEPNGGDGPARLGIVDPDERKLRLARRMLEEGKPWRGRSDIWFTPTPLGGKVAFLFPGVEPTFGADGIDVPGLAGRVGLEAPELSDDTIPHRSASIVRLGIFLERALRRLGVAPDVIAGHSIGEWGGSVAAGVFTRQDADGLLDGIDPHDVSLPDLDFAALSAGVDQVEPIVAGVQNVVVSHDNCPGQSVVCGPPADVATAMAALRAAGVLGYTLDFQSGFHTPFIEPALVAFRDYLESMTVRAARVPMWSATDVGPYPTDPAEIVDLHLRHLVEPVRFRPLVERLWAGAGVRVFVQLGIGALTGFVDDTLGDRPHACVPVVTAKRSALGQMVRALTALWVEGLDVDLTRLLAPSPTTAVAATPAVTSVQTATPALAPVSAVPAAAGGTPATTAGGGPAAAVQPSVALLGAAQLVTSAARAGSDVLGALLSRLGGPAPETGGRLPAPGAASEVVLPAAPSPVAVPVPATTPASPPPPAWPTETVKLRRTLSLDNMPETVDHSLYQQPPGWPDLSDGFPIVAMTTQIQLLQDIATEYGGGREVVEVFGVRNLRWLELSVPQDVDITVTPKGDDVLSIALGTYCRANLRLGASYPEAPVHEPRPLVDPRPTMVTAQEMFDLQYMFHGPLFQGIRSMGPIGEDGIVAEFDNLATPGSLLDNLGKIIAWFVIDERRNVGESPLPIGVDRITFFGPLPAPDVELHCDVRVVELQAHGIKADGVIVLPDGRLWCRVEGWSSHVFHIDQVMEPIYHDPGNHYATEPDPGGAGWSVLLERWPSGAGRDLTARRFLTRAERAVYDGLNLMDQRRWLLDVIAAKDSVRRWLADTYGIPSYPVEVTLAPDGPRRFRAVSSLIPEQHDLCITVSAINWLAVAIVGDGEYRDVEADPSVEAAIAAVSARNPGVEVSSVAEVSHITPSNIEVVVVPSFGVAWT